MDELLIALIPILKIYFVYSLIVSAIVLGFIFYFLCKKFNKKK